MAEKRVSEIAASSDPAAPPLKKQRLAKDVSGTTNESKSPEKIDIEIKTKTKTTTKETKNDNKTKNDNNNNNNNEEIEDIDIETNEKRIIFLTGNKGKLMEVQNFFDESISKLMNNEKLDLEETQGTPKEIIEKKLLSAKELLKKKGKNGSILVEDTSLILNAYSKTIKSESESDNNEILGMPGPYIKWLLKWDNDGNEGLCKMVKGLNDNKAYAICIFGFLPENSEKCLFFEGVCEGIIPNKPLCGENGFGWDPVFVPKQNKDNEQSFAQMTTLDKNKISHRGKALNKFKTYLENLFINNKNKNEKENENKTKK